MNHPFDVIDSSWIDFIQSQMALPNMVDFKENILSNVKYYPDSQNIFRVFSVPISKIKVVILGQDPYFTPNTAIGRAFAVNPSAKIPPSLRNIRKEIENTVPFEPISEWETLQQWEQQGVFLLNTALTVESGKAGSHLKYWREFTQNVITRISTENPCIWMLWGMKAKEFIPYIKGKTLNTNNYTDYNGIPIDSQINYIMTSAHPAAESYSKNAGFFGCDHFNLTNVILQKQRQFPINW